MNGASLYLTWSEWRATPQPNKTVIRIPHPYIAYRRIKGLTPKENRAGTLVFVPHSLPGQELDHYDFQDYLAQLDGVGLLGPESGFMLHSHDINRGLHRELRRFGLPLFTAGTGESPLFVERFYAVMSDFCTATSSEFGSQTLLSEEFGVPYAVFGTQRLPTPPREEFNAEAISRQQSFEQLLAVGTPRDEIHISQAINSALSPHLFQEALRDELRLLMRREVKKFGLYLNKLRWLALKNSAIE